MSGLVRPLVAVAVAALVLLASGCGPDAPAGPDLSRYASGPGAGTP